MVSGRGIFRVAALPALALLLAASLSCDGDGDATPQDGSPTPALQTEVTRETAGVRLKLSVEKATYKEGETVRVSAQAENLTSDQLAAVPAGPSQSAFSFSLFSQIGGDQALSADGGPVAPEGEAFGPGERVNGSVAWDQQVASYQDPVPGPPGEYTITAEISVIGGALTMPAVVGAAVTFRLEGGEAIILPDIALTVALTQPEVKQWFEGRANQNVICFWGQRGLFYNGDSQTASVAETLELLYDAHLQNGWPICSPVTRGDDWLLIFSSPEAPEPKRISVFLDLHDGTFRRVEEGGPMPQSTGAPSP